MTAPAADTTCLCGDAKSVHRLGRKGCKAPDCGCGLFEAADDAAEKTRVLEVVATVCEDQADRARTELGQESASARLRAVEAENEVLRAEVDRLTGVLANADAAGVRVVNELREVTAERDEALGDAERARRYWHNCSADRDAIKARCDSLEQLLADATRKLVEQGNEYSAELVRLRVLLEDAEKRIAEQELLAEFTEQHVRDMQDDGVIPPVELYGYDAWQCDTCGSRYRPFHDHPCGPLKPVRVSITERQEHHPL